MSFVLLPCEIYHCEFDAADFGIPSGIKISNSSLIGYDKHFSILSKSLLGCTGWIKVVFHYVERQT